MNVAIRIIRILLSFKNLVFSLNHIYISPGIQIDSSSPELLKLYKRALKSLVWTYPNLPHLVLKKLVIDINDIDVHTELVNTINTQVGEIETVSKYIDKWPIDLLSFLKGPLPQLNDYQKKTIEDELRGKFQNDIPVLILGGLGYIGSHLAIKLASYKCSCIHLLDTKEISSNHCLRATPNQHGVVELPEISRIESDVGYRLNNVVAVFNVDISNKQDLKAFFDAQASQNIKYRYIFNFASNDTDPLGHQDFNKSLNVNLNGVLNLLEIVCDDRKTADKEARVFSNLVKIIHASTDKTAGMKDIVNSNNWDDIKRKIGTYDATKFSADILGLIFTAIYMDNSDSDHMDIDYVRNDFPEFVVARLCNIFGGIDPNDNFRYLPKSVKNMVVSQKSPNYYEDSKNDYREYLYIEDAVRILLQIAMSESAKQNIIDIPGCYYHKTKEIALTLYEQYNKFQKSAGLCEIAGRPTGENSSEKRWGLVSQKDKTSATRIISILKNVGFTIPFKRGVESTIAAYHDLYIKDKTMMRKKKCLVTGGKGFIGSHLVEKLVAYDNEVVVIDIEDPLQQSYYTIQGLDRNKSVKYKQIDIREKVEVKAIVENGRFDFIFHLAAQPITPYSNELPELTEMINVGGTKNICETICSLATQPTLVLASSACYYGACQSSPLIESDPPTNEGASTYSLSKQKAEELVKNSGIKSVICRMVNIYGPGDRHESRIFPKIIRGILDDKAPELTRSKGDSILSFMYVDDAVNALMMSALSVSKYNYKGEVFNFGLLGDNPRSINQLINTIYKSQDMFIRQPKLPTKSKDPVVKKFLNPTKAFHILGWFAQYDLDKGIAMTFDWEKVHRKELKPKAISDIVVNYGKVEGN